MLKNRFEEFVFVLMTSGLMIYVMGVYNVAIHSGGLHYETFLYASMSFPLEWLVGLLFIYFIAGKLSKKLAFKVVVASDRKIVKILCIQTFTVCLMVPFMSMIGTIESSGITIHFLVIWIQTMVLNFIMAYPLQLLGVGPFCRAMMKRIFANSSDNPTDKNVINT